MLQFFAQKINHPDKNIVENLPGPNTVKIIRKPNQEPGFITLPSRVTCQVSKGRVVLDRIEYDLGVIRTFL
jgi:hypothetical protein